MGSAPTLNSPREGIQPICEGQRLSRRGGGDGRGGMGRLIVLGNGVRPGLLGVPRQVSPDDALQFRKLADQDAEFFTIGPTSGILEVRNPLDFENPVNANGNNRYLITVIATDDGMPSQSSTLGVAVIIEDANEAGTVSPITGIDHTGISDIGQILTPGTVTDPDGNGRVTVVQYEWQRSGEGDNYDLIYRTTDSTYALQEDDEDHRIRVIVIYTDKFIRCNTATSAATAEIFFNPKIADLDGDKSSVSINDAKFLYYIHALNLVPENDADLVRILGPLTSVDNSKLGNLLTTAQGLLTDLTGNGATDVQDAAVLYYSFALEGSLGDGRSKPGIEEIKEIILGPLAITNDIPAIDAMLQRVYDVVREPEIQDVPCSNPENQGSTQSCLNRLKVRKITKL